MQVSSPVPPANSFAHLLAGQNTNTVASEQQQQQKFWQDYNNNVPVEQQPHLRLNDGNQMPMLGLGTWNGQGKELKDAVKSAIYAGYRHIDTASNYRNEELVGQAIHECIQEKVVRRKQLFVTTKLWNNSHTRGSVEVALRKSLKALATDYVDLYLIHYPIGYQEGGPLSPVDAYGKVSTSDVDYVETWQGMEDVKRLGLTRSIGLSNFNVQQIRRILANCSTVPSMNQVECHPYLSQCKLLQFCRSHGIQLTAYSPLGSPGRLDARPQDLHLLKDPVITQLARKYRRSAAHILIRYQLERDIVVIPKAIQLEHIESNLKALSFQLQPEDMKTLDSLNRNYRFMKFERCIKHIYYPFKDEF